MWSAWWEGVLAGYAIAVPVGAIGVLIVALSARSGLRTGALAASGVAAADALYAAVATVGGAAVADVISPAGPAARRLAGAVLVLIAARTAWLAWQRYRTVGVGDSPSAPPSRPFLSYLVLTLVNPATVLYFAALVVARPGEATASAGAVFVAGVAAASGSWQLLLAGGGAAVGRHLAGRRGQLATGLLSAVIIAGLAVWLAR